MGRPASRATRRGRFWPFGEKGNRRVRLTATSPSPAKPKRTVAARLKSARRGLTIFVTLVVVVGGSFGAHFFFTRSAKLAVKELRFSSLRHATVADLSARAGVPLGVNLFSVDLAAVERNVARDPFVRSVSARRELPSAISIDVVEREPELVVELGGLYLVDSDGAVFKHATTAEAASLPVVTGLGRDDFQADPDSSRHRLVGALIVARQWAAGVADGRPALGELHFDRLTGVTCFTADGVGVRIGRSPADDDTLPLRLGRLDQVWAALRKSGDRPRLIYLDNRARPDRVTVKLAVPVQAPASDDKGPHGKA